MEPLFSFVLAGAGIAILGTAINLGFNIYNLIQIKKKNKEGN